MAGIRRNGRRKIMKINPPMEEDTSNLPCDIIENILSRLPVKSLVKFKSVSKSWYSLISDAKFARIHLHQSKNSDYKTLFAALDQRPLPQNFHLLKLANQSFQIEELEFPLKKYRRAVVLCSCDGLVLLKKNRECVLWNPTSRTYTKFSSPYSIDRYLHITGLCYDAFNDDYKFVLVFFSKCYAVFSYKNNTWVEKTDPSLLHIKMAPGLSVNGALHWVAYESRKDFDYNAKEGMRLQQLRKTCTGCLYNHYVNCPVYRCDYSSTYEIFCFDPRVDKFKKFSKPPCFDNSSIFELIELRGQLCVYRNTYDSTMVEIWMMKEYGDCNSWTKLLTIENVPVSHQCRFVRPFYMTNEGHILVFIGDSGIVLYNSKTKQFGDIENFNGLGNILLSPRIYLDESLVLPSRSNNTTS